MVAPNDLRYSDFSGLPTADLRTQAVETSGYLTALFPDQRYARRIVNPRRGALLSIPMAGWRQQGQIQEHMFEKFGLVEYEGCTTAEMPYRPVPQVFQTSETRAITELFQEWAPLIYRRLMRDIKPPIQTLNKTSRLGWPWFTATENKKEALRPLFDRLVTEGVDWMREAFIIMNVRLQAESKKKEREFLFVNADGDVYSKKVGSSERRVNTPLGLRTASRTRLVFNLPVANLLTQVLDTAMHNALLQYPAFHHDMYSTMGAGKMEGATMFFDVKHFERHTSEIVRTRSKLIGGLYSQIGSLFDGLPFLCPSDDWSTYFLLWPHREAGYSDQFASGYSPVAPVQKEIFWALYSEFAVRVFGMAREDALTWVAAGGDHRLKIVNYGDDNATAGDPGVLKEILPFFSEYLHVEEEHPPKFLGFLYTANGWKLGVPSYLLKTYLNERRPYSNFRRYPCFGWREKRKIYAQYGVPELATSVFPEENVQLTRAGIPWARIEREAAAEAVAAQGRSGLFDTNWITGKDWLMTPEEKLATGEFEGFSKEETAPLLKSLLSTEWQRQLTW